MRVAAMGVTWKKSRDREAWGCPKKEGAQKRKVFPVESLQLAHDDRKKEEMGANDRREKRTNDTTIAHSLITPTDECGGRTLTLSDSFVGIS